MRNTYVASPGGWGRGVHFCENRWVSPAPWERRVQPLAQCFFCLLTALKQISTSDPPMLSENSGLLLKIIRVLYFELIKENNSLAVSWTRCQEMPRMTFPKEWNWEMVWKRGCSLLAGAWDPHRGPKDPRVSSRGRAGWIRTYYKVGMEGAMARICWYLFFYNVDVKTCPTRLVIQGFMCEIHTDILLFLVFKLLGRTERYINVK